MRMRRFLAVVLAVCIAPTPAAVGSATGSPDNVAVAVNTLDGSTKWKVSFDISRVRGDVVDSTNLAYAEAQCQNCTTYAVAFQGVLASESPGTVTPINLALAVNNECSTCLTAAEAYQSVVVGGERLQFTEAAREELEAIKEGLKELREQNLPFDQAVAAIEAYGERFKAVFRTGLVPADGGWNGDVTRSFAVRHAA